MSYEERDPRRNKDLEDLTNQNIINAFFGRKDKKAIIIPNLECYIENNEKGVLNDIINI